MSQIGGAEKLGRTLPGHERDPHTAGNLQATGYDLLMCVLGHGIQAQCEFLTICYNSSALSIRSKSRNVW